MSSCSPYDKVGKEEKKDTPMEGLASQSPQMNGDNSAGEGGKVLEPNSNTSANKDIVFQLASMGFNDLHSQLAAINTSNAGVEEAMHWLFSYMEDPDIDDPISPVEALLSIVDQSNVDTLVSIGFQEEIARKGLNASCGDIEKATDWIFSHPEGSGLSDMDATSSGTQSAADAGLPDGGGRTEEEETGAPRAIPTDVRSFTYKTLSTATQDFSKKKLLGKGWFGPVYKGHLEIGGQEIAVKLLNKGGFQGSNGEFKSEIQMLTPFKHPNIVSLIGCSCDGLHRLIVYEFMSLGSLDNHLHALPRGREPLDWNKRMKIAAGSARGLEYLHREKSLQVYRDFKASKILLDKGYNPKISDLELAREDPRVMGTMGYIAPEYSTTGHLTLKCDVYSFGVVLLELLTGRKAIDNTLPRPERLLVSWARSRLKDPKKEGEMGDPLMNGRYPVQGFCRALAIARNCCEEEPNKRPNMEGVAEAISVIATKNYNPQEDQDSAGSSSLRQRNKAVDRERERAVAEAKEWALQAVKIKVVEEGV